MIRSVTIEYVVAAMIRYGLTEDDTIGELLARLRQSRSEFIEGKDTE